MTRAAKTMKLGVARFLEQLRSPGASTRPPALGPAHSSQPDTSTEGWPRRTGRRLGGPPRAPARHGLVPRNQPPAPRLDPSAAGHAAGRHPPAPAR